MTKHQITHGVYYLDASEAGIRILCGCPMDSVKRLMRAGFIQPIEDDKWEWQSGPNCILLSDISFQNGELCNLTEFPIMHMLYKQGMGIPQHPGFGSKPTIIGIPEQIRGQIEYLERGVNGLTANEIKNDPLTDDETKKILLAFKSRFKFGSQSSSSEFIEFQEIKTNEEPYELAPDFYIVRLGLNVYLFQYKDQEEIIDLTITENQSYGVPYNLDFHPTTRRDFSVIHNGEGNGWDMDRPCMASVLCAAGQYYLIDAGPNILEGLHKLGIGLNEVVGLFQTHAHDDHFAGLTSILRSEHRIKFYATPIVRRSVVKKLSALMSFDENNFAHFFEICDLRPQIWSSLNGFEVLPVMSPHPLETNIFYFRKKVAQGYRSYGHLADVISHRVHTSFLEVEDEFQNTLKENYKHIWKYYYLPVNIKKIDANSGLIHGDPEDYIQDNSGKIILSHITGSLPIEQQTMGSTTVFGSEDLLIQASKDYLCEIADHYLSEYFPQTNLTQRTPILSQRRILISAGTVILHDGKTPEYVYMILSGLVKWISHDKTQVKILDVGSLLSEEDVIAEQASFGTYIAQSYIKTIRIPANFYKEFVNNHTSISQYTRKLKERRLLQDNQLFRNINSRKILNLVLEQAQFEEYQENEDLHHAKPDCVALIIKGMAGVFYKSMLVETLSEDSFYGQNIFLKIVSSNDFFITALSPVMIMHVPTQIFLDTPILLWALLEAGDNLSKLISQTIRVLETTDQNMNLTLKD
ncbi:MAG: cyclic nucleotide-binding domain-containing protein [Spirochaetia bacterium]